MKIVNDLIEMWNEGFKAGYDHAAAELRWIPVSERLPDRDGTKVYSQVPCWVTTKDGYVEQLRFNHEHMCWDDFDGDDFNCAIEDVTAWIEIIQPKPYTEPADNIGEGV